LNQSEPDAKQGKRKPKKKGKEKAHDRKQSKPKQSKKDRCTIHDRQGKSKAAAQQITKTTIKGG
jgi:hypothetical protein